MNNQPMMVRQLPIGELQPPEQNIRMHTEKQLREFERSVSMFGQIRPIVVDENRTILAGNGLYKTMLRMGKVTVDVLVLEGLTPVQKKKLMIADNKVYSLGVDDLDVLDSFLRELGTDLDVPGFDEEILRSMMADAAEISAQICEYGALPQEEVDEIRNSAERRQAQQAQTSASGSSADALQPTNEREPIICPKCGEEIWL